MDPFIVVLQTCHSLDRVLGLFVCVDVPIQSNSIPGQSGQVTPDSLQLRTRTDANNESS